MVITRVWGKADHYELVFSPSGDLWEAAVPADMDDGMYVVELYALDDIDNQAYWTGILYINSSKKVKVTIVADKIKVWLMADNNADIEGDRLFASRRIP